MLFGTSKTPKLLGETSIRIALLSAALPTIIDSDTKTFRFLAMAIASSILVAYCKISRAKTEIGVFAIKGIFDFPAFIVIVNPFVFIPETAPVIPAQVYIINGFP